MFEFLVGTVIFLIALLLLKYTWKLLVAFIVIAIGIAVLYSTLITMVPKDSPKFDPNKPYKIVEVLDGNS